MTDLGWMDSALCPHVDTNIFFEMRDDIYVHEAEIKELCSMCSVQIRCADYALADESIVGMWGGLTDSERDEIRLNRTADVRFRESMAPHIEEFADSVIEKTMRRLQGVLSERRDDQP